MHPFGSGARGQSPASIVRTPSVNDLAAEQAPAANQSVPCRRRILLVDDQKSVQEAIKFLLRLDDYAVTEAADGAAAMELFMQGHFDLVITDFEMPHLNGIELAARIRQSFPTQPILMLTAYAEQLQATANLVDAILEKPFQLEKLRRILRELLS